MKTIVLCTNIGGQKEQFTAKKSANKINLIKVNFSADSNMGHNLLALKSGAVVRDISRVLITIQMMLATGLNTTSIYIFEKKEEKNLKKY